MWWEMYCTFSSLLIESRSLRLRETHRALSRLLNSSCLFSFQGLSYHEWSRNALLVLGALPARPL